MVENKFISVVIPAYNEGKLITKTLETMPSFVDKIIVVNDGSKDNTLDLIKACQNKDPRIEILNHDVNKGLGQTLIDGYLHSRKIQSDVTAIMAGDAQMAPEDLINVVTPIAEGKVHYVKGNRFFMDDVVEKMPFYRLVGNAGLTILTKFATGYWHIIDPQCGYTAISKDALAAIPIQRMTKKYGYNADILNMLNIRNFVVADVDVKPVYGEEVSKIQLHKYIPKISMLLIRLFLRRLLQKYLIRNFNPLCISYLLSMFLFFFGVLPFGIRTIYIYFSTGLFPQTSFLTLMFVTLAAVQMFLFAIQYDMEDNRVLSAHFDSRNKK
ncbi:Undecaprenyl-phosphate mannosyltransferase [compost metagenome]